MTESPGEILLVEDDPYDLELTLHALKRNHLADRVQVVRDGTEVFDLVLGTGVHAERPARSAPKLILLDLKLPKVAGMEVLRRIKSDPRTRTIPVVVLTSSFEDRDLLESYRLGANSFITKPGDFEQFVAAVGQLGHYWLLLNEPPHTD